MSKVAEFIYAVAEEHLQRLQRENAKLREQVATLTDLVDRQVVYIKELKRQLGTAPHDYEPPQGFHGGPE